MSTVTKAISSVEFHVNARQANAALQSIQEEAKRCRQQVEELQEQAAKGVTTVKVDGMDVDIQKRIKEVKALQKTWESAAQSQIKGAKAFDELWKNARMGTIESMNGAQIKAGINASKPIYDRLRLGDAEDRMKAQAIKDMQDQGQKVLNQLKTTTDQIIKQIADGETIAADVLEREARNLKSIMDLLPPLSQEWKDYNLQYQAINQQIERQTVLERQLRGEIVTREDAIRVINAANREATQQEIAQEEQRAKAAREAAEAKAAEADQYRTTVEQKQSEIFATNDLIAAKRREIDAHHESAAAAKADADKARDAAYQNRKQAEQEARNQQDAYNKQKKIRDDAAKDVEKFRKELEKLGEQDEKRAGVQQKFTDAETRLADENRKLNEQADKTITANQQATQAVNTHQQSVKALGDVMEENRKTGQRLGKEMGQLTKQHKQQTEELAEASEKMTDAEKESNRHIKTEQEARLRIQQLNNQSIEQLTASLRVFEEENRRINDPGNQRWQENERYIGQLNLRLEELKKQSAELRREPVLDMMTQRMQSLSTLSADALQETKKFWEAQRDGAKNFSEEYTKAKEALELLAKEERQRVIDRGESAFDFFQREDYRRTNAADTEEQRKALVAYRDALPADATDHIEAINALLEKQAQFVKEAAGEWMSLEKAMELASKAGTDQFAGSAKDIQLATQSLERQRDTIIATIREKRNLGQATKTEEDQLADLTKKLRSLKFEQDNVNMSQEKMRTLIETPANAVNLDELRAAIKRADGQLRQMEQSLGQNSDEYKRFAEQVRQAKNVMKEMEGQAKASATAWEKAFSRLKTYVVMYMGFNEVWQKVSNTARDLMDLSDRMGEVRKTTGFTADEVGRLSENLKKMDVRTSLTSLMELSASAGQLGLKTLEDVQGFTEAANKLMIALPEMGREAATEMMRVAIATGEVDKIRKQLQEGTIEGSSATAVAMEKIASTIDRLRASSASTAPEITDFVKRVGAVGAQSGITIDQVAALGSTVSSLGMRVEMSATALSRMIPAIRRNAFDVAHAIGMAPEALRKMFDEAGGGMNAMLEIFQHIKDAGMDEDDIEKMLGMGDMAEIMKELNQQGARAGIVFAGLSQNVDELRRQLGVANQAYDENIAIQQEFDKMNETTAAKWERLKNKFEEMFVGDEAQQWLGKIIDGARVAVDIFEALQGYIVRIAAAFALWKVGVGGAIWTYLINPIRLAATGVHSLDFQVKGFAATWRTAWKSMDAATKANWIAALASAFYMLGKYIYDSATRVSELQQELNRLDIETDDAVSHVGRLVTAFNDSSVKAEAAAKKQADLQAQTDRLSKEVDKLKKSTDEGTASTDELKRKQTELEEKEKELKKATDESNKANQARSNLISEMNSKYSTYLGYMLNEKTAAEQVASAHQLIVAALKEERKQKGLNALHDAVDKEYADDIKEYSENSQEELSGIARDAQRRIMDQWRRVLTAVTPDAKTGNFTLAAVDGVTKGGTYGSEAELKAAMRSALRDIVRTEAGGKNDRVKVSTWAGTKYKSLDDYLDDIWGGGTDDGFGNWAETYINRERDIAKVTHDNEVEVNQAHKERIEAAVNDQRTNLENLQKLAKDNNQFTDDQIRQMAQDVNALVTGFDKFGKELSGADEIFGKDKERTLQNAVNNVLANLDQKTRARVFRVAQNGQKSTNGTGSVSVPSGTNIWGSNAPADSTDYSLFDVNELVARRNQMDKFKNILKPDTDVRTVLAEDKALMKALDNGLKSDWKSVLDWYNAERKKIQEELKSERFSTNTGHWRDEKNGRGRKNRFRESDYALAELDRYYSRRKEKLEKAREEEGMSEELFNREVELLEQEHLERRSKLRETFTAGTSKQEQEMVAQFRLWWDKLEKSGDLDEVPWATVESEWAKALASEIGRNNLKAQQDLTQLQSITVKHLNAIAKLIDQERPYDGITANLRKNLTEMDILLADMVKDGPAEDTAKLVSEQGKRLQFLLTEAEHAYALTFDDLAKKMREQGLGDWADALMIDEQKKQSLMQNLRNVYDQIQEAIKKEASIIKKQLEIQWNDMLTGQEMSMKGTFEKAISDLGLAGDQVKRANSLIGAGAASERVADKLAIQQMKVQLAMQQTYFALMQKIGDERVRQLRLSAEANDRDAKALKEKAEQLRREGKITEAETKEREAEIAARQALQDSFDAEHAQKSLNLAKTKEIAEEEKQRVAIQNQLEESQNRLYTELRSWADLLTSSLQGVMEASHAGDAEYYNERAKLDLTGKGGPGAGTYVVIDDAGTSDAKAHYEYLDERQALERQHEIEVQNAQAEAWKKLMDDINMKMSEQITDWLNAAAQNASVDANTDATLANTKAIVGLTAAMGGKVDTSLASGLGYEPSGNEPNPTIERIGYEAEQQVIQTETTDSAPSVFLAPNNVGLIWEQQAEAAELSAERQVGAIDKVKTALDSQFHKQSQGSKDANQKMTSSTQSAFAKMTQAANMYGIAYQVMQNDNLSASQKFGLMAVQAAGQAAITSLTVDFASTTAQTAADTPSVLSKLYKQLGWGAIPVFAVFTGLLGGLLGLAASKIAKSKSEIAQATGASVGAGRLATGMLTYAEGNVNELTDPASLTTGRQYNVDGADGKTYRAKYMGKGAKTHITNGPEFHLVGEAGREAIIDAKTTRLLQMNETGIWRDIQTLYNGGSISGLSTRRRRGGVRAFADGNVGEFEEMSDGGGLMADGGADMGFDPAALQASLDRNSEVQELLLERLQHPLTVAGTGPNGVVAMYDKLKKEAQRHGEKYI